MCFSLHCCNFSFIKHTVGPSYRACILYFIFFMLNIINNIELFVDFVLDSHAPAPLTHINIEA